MKDILYPFFGTHHWKMLKSKQWPNCKQWSHRKWPVNSKLLIANENRRWFKVYYTTFVTLLAHADHLSARGGRGRKDAEDRPSVM